MEEISILNLINYISLPVDSTQKNLLQKVVVVPQLRWEFIKEKR